MCTFVGKWMMVCTSSFQADYDAEVHLTGNDYNYALICKESTKTTWSIATWTRKQGLRLSENVFPVSVLSSLLSILTIISINS